MNILKDIPAENAVTHSVDRIVLNIPEEKAYVQIDIPGRSTQTVVIDIIQLFSDYSVTTTQKKIIREFIKAIIAQAFETDVVNIPEVLTEQ